MSIKEKIENSKVCELFRNKNLARLTLILSVIYTLSFSAIIRADFYYIDDLGRGALGYSEWGYSRHLSNILSTFLHTDTYLSDISPLTQIVSAILLAFASAVLISLFSNVDKIRISSIIAVLPLGLSPYFLECVSYKFDCVYMALSILAMILPFLFAERPVGYCVASFLGVLVMCMTYQAASGVYIFITLFLALKRWNEAEELKKTGRFIIKSAVSYAAGILVFLIAFHIPYSEGYANSSLLPLPSIIPGGIQNLAKYYGTLLSDFRTLWLILAAAAAVCFIIFSTLKSKRNKAASCGLACLCTALSLASAFGLYIFLEEPLFEARAMYGFGVLLAVIAVQAADMDKFMASKILCAALSWCFAVFSFTYGNALNEQKRYTDFRIQMVVEELNDLPFMSEKSTKILQLNGSIGKSPVIHFSEDSDMLNRLIPQTFAGTGWTWSEFYFRNYFGLDSRYIRWDRSQDLRRMELPVLKETMYYRISGNEKYILVDIY